MTQYGFYLDSSACTGCKACQAACKDKHGLPVGVLYRRVYEVTGGGWERVGQAWVSDVFAYNMSLSCNHCARPICAEVCPADAYSKRPDGIVLLDGDRCIGCQYCTWACPYGAPQYDSRKGITEKCTMCDDDIDAGRSPACVAACPLRALEFGDIEEIRARHGITNTVYPLPDAALTEPALAVTPHLAAARTVTVEARIGNAEEVQTLADRETPLVIFTILAQLAVGAFWTLGALNGWGMNGPAFISAGHETLAWPLIFLVMLVGILVSFQHLGRPDRAWRVFSNLRHSALSREVLFAVLFVSGAGVFAVTQASMPGALIPTGLVGGMTALAGLGLVYSMAQAYRLRTIPGWDGWTTPATFFATTLSLGGASTGFLLTLYRTENGPGIDVIPRGIALWTSLLLIVQLVILWHRLGGFTVSHNTSLSAKHQTARHGQMLCWRVGLLVVGILVAISASLLPGAIAYFLCLLLVLSSETLGRILFYAARALPGV